MRMFDIAIESGPDTLRLTLTGELDYTTADELTETVEAHLTEETDHLRLDCAGLTWCDSSGLAAILNLRRTCADAGVRLHLDNRAAHLDRVLQLTGTLEHLAGPEPG